MSNALAIAGVSAVLKDLLDTGLIELQLTDILGTSVLVSALSPDMVPIEGDRAVPRLNLFLHQVTPNAGWRNVELPSRNGNGNRLTNPPLALDLHYLLTAYGIADLEAEVLLGYGMQLLHENPVLTRASIRASLNRSPVMSALLPPVYQALQSADLAEQMETLKISPMAMAGEEMSRLWSALQARYRPTVAFQVSVVLIESQRAASAPLPVLTRGRVISGTGRDEGVSVMSRLVPPYPTLESVVADAHNTPSTVQLGDSVTIRGHDLAGTSPAVVLRSNRFDVAVELTPEAPATHHVWRVTIPQSLAGLPVGLYQLEVRVTQTDAFGEPRVRTSNALPVALAPAIDIAPDSASLLLVPDEPAVLVIRVDCNPAVRAGQKVELFMDTRSAVAMPFDDGAETLEFRFSDPPVGNSTPLLRLRVDGIESVSVNRAVKPAAFMDDSRVTVPV